MFDLHLLDDLNKTELQQVINYIREKTKKKDDIFDSFLKNYKLPEKYTKQMYIDFQEWCKKEKIITPLEKQFARIIKEKTKIKKLNLT